MNTQQDKSGGGARQGARPVVVIGVIAVATLVVLAAGLILRPKSGTPSGGATPTELAAGGVEHSTPTAPSTNALPEHQEHAPPLAATAAGDGTTGAAAAATGPQVNVQDLIRALNNSALPMSERKAAIQALAKLGTPEAIAALKEALAGGNEELRAAVAEGLGGCVSPECTAMLLDLLNDPSQAVIQAAIRGLAQLGTPEATAALAKMLNDPLRSSDIRSSAALGLGDISGPGAMQALAQAALTIGDEDIVTQVLDAIGGRDFSETQSFFQQYMGSAVSSDLRVAAIESLWQAKGDPSTFLSGYLTDGDAEVRASAAWAMSATDTEGNAGAQLLATLQGEQDPEVRRRLFQALGNQEGYDANSALALVQRETDPTARIAGMDLLAASLRDDPSPAVQTYFDQTATPVLKNTALTGESNHERMAALIALVRASTPAAMSALQDLSQQASDPRIKQSAARVVANPMPTVPKASH